MGGLVVVLGQELGLDSLQGPRLTGGDIFTVKDYREMLNIPTVLLLLEYIGPIRILSIRVSNDPYVVRK